ncbi:hypothetical protein GCM10022409_32160 [Hymenobacter glaciei]|uniref:Peptidase M56 domain-containing protein n=1 Tax=Hymenobacter glaciei TaxID=877209 RepID=A0ABP7UHS4_9BACT
MATSTSILLYLLKANGVLLLFVAAYFGLLRRLTFFTLNRVYLVLALLFAALYPALPVPALLPAEATPAVLVPVVGNAEAFSVAAAVPSAPAVDWAAVGVALYAAGTAVLLARLLVQLLALAQLRRRSRPAVVGGLAVRVLTGEISPFSFAHSIYLNPDQHPGPELAAVLRHEQVHVRQAHTFDVLLAQLGLAAAWCNPAAWLLRRALLDNLEFLADQAVLATGLDRRAYQYSLLRLSHAPAGPSLVSHFTFPSLKTRVVMMNTPLSTSGQLARYFVAGPLVLAVALGISGARAQSGAPVGVPAAKAVAVPADSAPTHKASAKIGSAVDPASPQLPDGIKAYLAKTYPGSTIRGYFAADRASEKALHVQYYASITTSNGAKHKLYFNSRQELVTGPNQLAQAASRVIAGPAARAASSGPAHTKPAPIVYLDGQRYAGDINNIGPKNIANISVFKGAEARQRFGVEAADGVVVVTTIAKQNDADVRGFNEKVGAGTEKAFVPAATATPMPAAASVPYLAAPALAYITQHYPAARLLGVTEVPAPDGGATRYQAQVAIGRRPAYLLFDGAGQFVSESYTSYLK